MVMVEKRRGKPKILELEENENIFLTKPIEPIKPIRPLGKHKDNEK